jgi:hypothetical protein
MRHSYKKPVTEIDGILMDNRFSLLTIVILLVLVILGGVCAVGES